MLNGLSNGQIVSMLGSYTLWSKRACNEILRRQNDFIPLLIELLDQVLSDLDAYMETDENPHIPAAMLLAQIREPQAYPRLIKLMSHDDEMMDDLWGDILTEYYSIMLRDTFNGDTTLIPPVVEDRSISPWSRNMAIDAQCMLYLDGYINRDEIAEFFRRLVYKVYTGRLDDHDEIVLSAVAYDIRMLRLEELIDDVMVLYSKDVIDEFLCNDKEKYVKEFLDPLYAPKDQHMDDAVLELRKWNWFDGGNNSDDDKEEW